VARDTHQINVAYQYLAALFGRSAVAYLLVQFCAIIFC